ncbi:MAG: undecaprenyldiphospho-muramoylpentapeptide beta-N-acetylglucosaminyltransferase [Candidatus Omnitrophica bacterium]|nr:undecaprenyldiphospho-muramoylpentapeptide beta-N-acetylglucosaminyltransferase [Candidatus Omnitrophota bacterium]
MNVLIATGGSGGHIFPAIETAKALKTRGHTVTFAGVLGLGEEKIKALGYPLYSLVARGLNDRSFKGWLSFGIIMFKAVFHAFDVIKKSSPDIIIGFGGYGAFPVVMAGVLMRLPTMIHEQNVVPGRANVLLSKIVKKVAISFEGSRKYFNRAKTVWTGCPCQHNVGTSQSEALAVFGLAEGKKTLLLLGGSQGAVKLNEIFFKLMQGLSLINFQAIHMTGKKDYSFYEKSYSETNLPVKVYAFINDMSQAYAAADIVITRAGAATISELGILGLPAILIPYPFAGNHQKHNADVLGACGAGIVIEQKDLTDRSLKKAVDRILNGDFLRENLRMRANGLFQKDAALQLALVAEGL